jgi:hypothetical protein
MHISLFVRGLDASDHLRKKETVLANNPKTARDRAEASFKKEQKAREGQKAMAEYEAAGAAVRAKTERLRALRLAKEAAEREKKSSSRPLVSN